MANTSRSSRLNVLWQQVGMCRVRPLQRQGMYVPDEAADREAAANKRWYRDE